MASVMEQIWASAGSLAQLGVSIWLPFWVIRRKGEMDEELDRAAQAVRWGLVIGGWLLASVPLGRFSPVRAAAALLGLAFLCWPNLAPGQGVAPGFRVIASQRHHQDRSDQEGIEDVATQGTARRHTRSWTSWADLVSRLPRFSRELPP